jgi:tape measure domain-containing protein
MAITIKTISDSRQARQDMVKLDRSLQKVDKTVKSSAASLQIWAKSLAVGFAAIAGFKGFTKLSDEIINLESRMKVITKSQEGFAKALRHVKDIAMATRSELGATAALYSKLTLASKSFAMSQENIASITKTIGESLKISGATTAEAQSVMLQFGQAIGSGNLAGEELRSVLEGNIILSQIIADTFDINIGQLREWGEEGRLTSKKILEGVLKAGPEITELFKKMGVTYSDAFQNMGTATNLFFDSLSKSLFGTGKSLADWINEAALGIYQLSKDIPIYIANIRLSFFEFVVYLEQLANTPINFFTNFVTGIVDSFQWLYNALLGNSIIPDIILGTIEWFKKLLEVIGYVKTFAKENVVIFSFLKTSVISIFAGIFYYFSNSFGKKLLFVALAIKAGMSFLMADGFGPKIIESISRFMNKVVNLFKWLYKILLGGSIIPDIVNDTIAWFKKLVEKPLEYVKKLVKDSEGLFSSLILALTALWAGFTAIFSKGLFGKIFFGMLAIKALLFLFITQGYNLKTLKKGFENTIESIKKFWKNLSETSIGKAFNKGLDSLMKKLHELKVAFHSLGIVHFFKQIFGIKDIYPGTLFGQEIDTSERAQVGLGKRRSKQDEDRKLLHDQLAAFPREFMIPFSLAIVGGLMLAFRKFFGMGILAALFGSVLTGVWTIAIFNAFKNVDTYFYEMAAKAFGFIIRQFTDFMRGNIAAGLDSLGAFVGIFLKAMLLFAAGRALFLRAGKQLASAPTRFSRYAGERYKLSTFDKAVRRRDIGAKQAEKRLILDQKAHERSLTRNTTALANLRDSNNRLIGRTAAEKALARGGIDPNRFGTAASRSILNANEVFLRSLKSQQDKADVVRKEVTDTNKQDREALRSSLAERREQNRQRIVGGLAGVGGTIGAIAGLQLGAKIAEGMSGSSELAKIGVIIAISTAGQLALAGVGTIIGKGIVASADFIGTRIGASMRGGFLNRLPFGKIIFLIGLAAVAITAGYYLFQEFWEDWKRDIQNIFASAEDIKQIKIREEKRGELDKSAELFTYLTEKLSKAKDEESQLLISGNIETLLDERDVIREEMSKAYDRMGTWVKLFESSDTGIKDIVGINANILAEAKRRDIAQAKRHKELMEEKVLPQILKKLDEIVTGPQIKSFLGIGGMPARFATGGFIQGPGNAKSDSVPTLLSNGEFVVNAADAKANRRILEMINSGYKAVGFANGTATTTNFAMQSKVIIADIEAPAQTKFGKAWEHASSDFSGILESTLEKGKELVSGIMTPDDIGKGVAKYSNLFNSLKGLDLGTEQTMSKLTHATATQLNHIEELTSIAERSRRLSETDTKIQATLIGFYKEDRGNLERALNKLSVTAPKPEAGKDGVGGKGDGKTTKTKKDVLYVRDQFGIISEMMPTLNLSIEQFRASSDLLQNQLFNTAAGLKKELKGIEDVKIGKLGDKVDLKLQSQYATLQANVDAASLEFSKKFLTPFEQISPEIQKFGIQLSESLFNTMDETKKVTLFALMDSLASHTADAKAIGADPELRAMSQEFADETIKEIQELLKKAVRASAGETGQIIKSGFQSGLSKLFKGDASLKDIGNQFLDNLTSSVLDTMSKRLTSGLFDSKSFGGILDSILEFVGLGVDKAKGSETDSDNITITSQEGLFDKLIGALEIGFSSIWTILSTMFSGIMTAFTTSAATGSFDWGGFLTKIGTSVVKAFGGTAVNSITSAATSSIAVEVSDGIAKGVTTAFDKIDLTLAYGASGGLIKGAGTGISDSIPAMLSNGEFVINAKEARKNFKLLTAINNGNIAKYASGGSVGTASTTSTTGTNNQTFNIAITGDISRQTRSEILKMIPVISSGVNKHNHETRY